MTAIDCSYHFARFLFVRDPEQQRTAHRAAVRCLGTALPYLDPPGRRVTVPFGGARLVGVLRLPRGRGRHPAVVMIPRLDSAKEELRCTEALFLERGVGTFSVDGPGQGEAEYDLPIRADWEIPGRAIVDTLSAQPDVDPDRIGVWGVSLGGYYAPRMAGGDERLEACVALAGPYDWGAAWDRLPGLTREAFRVRAHQDTDEGARNAAAALTLDGRAAAIRCPLLVVTGRLDPLIPWQDGARLAEEASGPATLLAFDDGNHGCSNIAAKHRYRTADWMADRLRAGPV